MKTRLLVCAAFGLTAVQFSWAYPSVISWQQFIAPLNRWEVAFGWSASVGENEEPPSMTAVIDAPGPLWSPQLGVIQVYRGGGSAASFAPYSGAAWGDFTINMPGQPPRTVRGAGGTDPNQFGAKVTPIAYSYPDNTMKRCFFIRFDQPVNPVGLTVYATIDGTEYAPFSPLGAGNEFNFCLMMNKYSSYEVRYLYSGNGTPTWSSGGVTSGFAGSNGNNYRQPVLPKPPAGGQNPFKVRSRCGLMLCNGGGGVRG